MGIRIKMIKKNLIIILTSIISISCQDKPEFTDVIEIVSEFNKKNPELKPFELTTVENIDIFSFVSNKSDDLWFAKCEGKQSDVIFFLMKKNNKNVWKFIWNSEYEKQWGSQNYTAEKVDIDSDGLFEVEQRYENMHGGHLVKSLSIVKFIESKPTIIFESIWGGDGCPEDLQSGDTISVTKNFSYIDKNNDGLLELVEEINSSIFLSYKDEDDVCERNEFLPPTKTDIYSYNQKSKKYLIK